MITVFRINSHSYALCRKYTFMIIPNMIENTYFQGTTMRHCGLQYVDLDAFDGLVSLGYLTLNNGHLTEAPTLQYIRKTLLGLDLRYNEITHIDDTCFAGCEKLRNTDISGNRISFAPNIDHIARSLISISLSMSQLSGVLNT